jgi:hypothetical protein
METPDLPAEFEAIREPNKRAYLFALAQHGVVRRAAATAMIHETLPWVWRQRDEAFVHLEEQARRLGGESLEKELYRRAVEGVDRPIYYLGRKVDTVKEYSDTLLIVALKATFPERYKERVEHSSDPHRPLTIQIVQEGTD